MVFDPNQLLARSPSSKFVTKKEQPEHESWSLKYLNVLHPWILMNGSLENKALEEEIPLRNPWFWGSMWNVTGYLQAKTWFSEALAVSFMGG